MSLIDMAACRSSCLLGDNITRFPARSSSPSPSPISPLPRPLSPVPPLHPTPAAGAPAGTAHAGGAPLRGLLFLMGCCFFWLEGNLAFVPFVGKNSEKVNVLYISAVNLTTLTFQNFYLEEAITDDDGIGDIVCRVLRYTRLFAVCLTLSLSLSLRLSACACVCVSLSLCLHASACLYLWDVSIVRPLLLAHMPCGVCPSPCR